MFGKRYNGNGEVGQTRDSRLHAVLGRWQAIEPCADFEAGVWQRIHAASEPETAGVPLLVMPLPWRRLHPAVVTALAASVAIVVGIWAGGASPVRGLHPTAHPLLHAQTLAGVYLTLSAGDVP